MTYIIYRVKKHVLILIVFQDSILVSYSCVETLISSFVTYRLVLYCFKCIFHDKYICGFRCLTQSFQQQTCNGVYYHVLYSLHLVGPFVH